MHGHWVTAMHACGDGLAQSPHAGGYEHRRDAHEKQRMRQAGVQDAPHPKPKVRAQSTARCQQEEPTAAHPVLRVCTAPDRAACPVLHGWHCACKRMYVGCIPGGSFLYSMTAPGVSSSAVHCSLQAARLIGGTSRSVAKTAPDEEAAKTCSDVHDPHRYVALVVHARHAAGCHRVALFLEPGQGSSTFTYCCGEQRPCPERRVCSHQRRSAADRLQLASTGTCWHGPI